MSSTTHKMSDLNYKRITGDIELTGKPFLPRINQNSPEKTKDAI